MYIDTHTHTHQKYRTWKKKEMKDVNKMMN